MNSDHPELQKIDALIKKSHRILIIPHRSPDGDTAGASLALYQALLKMGKAPEIMCVDHTPPEFSFLPFIDRIQKGEPTLNYDAYFIMDTGATHLTGLGNSHPALFDKSLEVVNIDHHASNDFYGRYNLISIREPSTTSFLYKIFEALNIPIDRHMATCLLMGIYTDTGSFLHSNTNSDVLRVSARLLAKGADLRSISKEIFNTTKISTMHLWGRVLRNIQKTDEGVAMSVVTQKDFEETGADYSEMNGAVDYVNSIPDTKYSVILTERGDVVKGSLRTLSDEVDVAAIAAKYGGGGHTKAAGFSIPGKLQKEIRYKVVDK